MIPEIALVALQSSPPLAQTLINLAPLLLIFIVFYFIVLAPARKRQVNLQKMIEGLKKGDRVVTNGGVFGEVVSVDSKTLILRVADNVKIKMTRAAIAGMQDPDSESSS